MTFSLSPAVNITEIDLTSIIPAVSTSTGALCGSFIWGPAMAITTVDSEHALANTFGKPTNTVYADFMVAASFLAYASNLKVVRAIDTATALNASCTNSSTGSGTLIKNGNDYLSKNFGSSPNLFVAKWPGALGNNLGVAFANEAGYNDTDSNGEPVWTWHNLFSSAPGTNEYHIVVYDFTGNITGTEGEVLEIYPFVSTDANAVYYDGSSGYFLNRINKGSSWLWVGKASLLSTDSELGVQLGGGADGTAASEGQRQSGYALFLDSDAIDISLVMSAGGGLSTMQYIIDDLVEVRKDCVALVSPLITDCVNIFDDNTAAENILTTRTSLGSSSYAVMDSAWKLMYDRYNDVNRWVPLNGDIAGLCANTDSVAAPWFSPAGLNRGNIKNCIALSNGQSKTIRDTLYPAGVNPCVLFPVDGPVLYGDKTLQARPSAFDRINVRRLFIVLEKAIATAAKFQLFELNDAITRTQFKNMIVPYLKDVQAQRGVTGFKVVCDESNNTQQIIDSNQFVADIYIQPTRSINFINLRFTAVATGVNFDEVVQQAPGAQ